MDQTEIKDPLGFLQLSDKSKHSESTELTMLNGEMFESDKTFNMKKTEIRKKGDKGDKPGIVNGAFVSNDESEPTCTKSSSTDLNHYEEEMHSKPNQTLPNCFGTPSEYHLGSLDDTLSESCFEFADGTLSEVGSECFDGLSSMEDFEYSESTLSEDSHEFLEDAFEYLDSKELRVKLFSRHRRVETIHQ